MDLNTSRCGDVCSGNNTGTLLTEVSGDGLVVFAGYNQRLDVQDDFSCIFLDTRNGGELVEYAVQTDAGYCCARNAGEQGTTERVTKGLTETWFKRFNDET